MLQFQLISSNFNHSKIQKKDRKIQLEAIFCQKKIKHLLFFGNQRDVKIGLSTLICVDNADCSL